MSILLFVCVINIIFTANGQIKVDKDDKGDKVIKFKDVNKRTRRVSFNTEGSTPYVQIGAETYIFAPKADGWYEIDQAGSVVPLTIKELVTMIRHQIKNPEITTIKIGDYYMKQQHWTGSEPGKHVHSAMKAHTKTKTQPLFAPPNLQQRDDGSMLITFSTLTWKERESIPGLKMDPWLRDVRYKRRRTVITKENCEKMWFQFRREKLRWNPHKKLWVNTKGEAWRNEDILHEVRNNPVAFFRSDILWPVIQSSGGITELPEPSSEKLRLEEDYVDLRPRGLRNPHMITRYWHPRLNEKTAEGPTVTDDLYWGRVRVDQLKDCTFDKNSEYLFLILHERPHEVRFLQERKMVSGRSELIHRELHVYRGFKFGHASMLNPEEYRHVNEFTSALKHDRDTGIYTEYLEPVNELVKYAGAFRTGDDGKIYYVNNDSGHFPVQGHDGLDVVVSQMKLDTDVVKVEPIEYRAYQEYMNLMNDYIGSNENLLENVEEELLFEEDALNQDRVRLKAIHHTGNRLLMNNYN